MFAESHVTFPLALEFPPELIRLDRFGMEICCEEEKNTGIDGCGKGTQWQSKSWYIMDCRV